VTISYSHTSFKWKSTQRDANTARWL